MDGISRRQMIVGGGVGAGLLVGYAALPRSYRPNLVATPGETVLGAFLRIGEDGRVTVIVPQAEMGQGVWTSLPQLLADELGADWRTIAVEAAPIDPLYANTFLVREVAERTAPPALAGVAGAVAAEYARRTAMMVTGGSTSIRGFAGAYRAAGATARALLCMAAAARWGVDWRACDTDAGFVVHGPERLRFAELAAAAAGHAPPDPLPLRGWREGGLAGTSPPRIDLPAKVDGTARFAADVRLPDMLYASIRQAAPGRQVTGFDPAPAFRRPGVTHVIDAPGWVAALGTNWWAADGALDLMGIRFAGAAPLPDDASIAHALADAMAGPAGARFGARGDADALLAAEAIQADYAVPFAVHAPIETLTATARITGDRLEVWVPTQAPTQAREAAARAIGFAEDRVTVYPMPIGGGFGRKADHDAVAQAAILAARAHRPVQLVWSREEETQHSRNRPPARARLSARLDGAGGIAAWRAVIATPATSGEAMHRMKPFMPVGGHHAEWSAVDGAMPPYRIPAAAIEHRPVVLGVETGIWRSVAHSYTAFFTESFIDELAAQARIDPFGFRMRLLGDNPRLARCLATVATLGGWDGGGAGSRQGLAAHACFGSYVAMLAEARVTQDGEIRVDRIVAAVDVGRVVHPQILRQQVEGGIVWGLAAALGGATGYAGGIGTARNFDALGLPRLADTPEIVVEIIPSEAASGGAGEIGVPTVAPAIANAIAAATGRRLRTLPLTMAEPCA